MMREKEIVATSPQTLAAGLAERPTEFKVSRIPDQSRQT